MRFLIVDGWTREGNLSHAVAGCEEQAGVFRVTRSGMPA